MCRRRQLASGPAGAQAYGRQLASNHHSLAAACVGRRDRRRDGRRGRRLSAEAEAEGAEASRQCSALWPSLLQNVRVWVRNGRTLSCRRQSACVVAAQRFDGEALLSARSTLRRQYLHQLMHEPLSAYANTMCAAARSEAQPLV